jgi:hypothetical protein
MRAVAPILIVFGLAVTVSAILWWLLRPTLLAAVFVRRNYRDLQTPAIAGVVLPLAVLVLVVAANGLQALLPRQMWIAEWAAVGPVLLGISFGWALLGVIDDLGGTGQSGGFRGHLRAAREGRVTTGLLKLLAGPLITLVLLGGGDRWSVALLRDVALVAATANVLNLFDRAPGRSIKWATVVAIVIVAISGLSTGLLSMVAIVGAGVGLLGADLAEELMLGDTGANVLGAALGLGMVAGFSENGRWIALGVIVGLNLASEWVSFGRIIDTVPPLRWFDRLGRARPRGST